MNSLEARAGRANRARLTRPGSRAAIARGSRSAAACKKTVRPVALLLPPPVDGQARAGEFRLREQTSHHLGATADGELGENPPQVC